MTFVAPVTTEKHAKQILTLAVIELKTLLAQRITLLHRIAVVRRTIAGLGKIFGDDLLTEELRTLIKQPAEKSRTSLTEACRAALVSSSTPLTPHELVDRIRANDPAVIEHHKDPAASVTSILHRLRSYGEATTRMSESGRCVWISIGNPRP